MDGNAGGDMKQGTKVELPLWLAEMLAISQNHSTSSLVTLDLPPALSARVMNALKADPRSVDLRALAPHFYNLGARMLELFEEDEMVEVLSEVLKELHIPHIPLVALIYYPTRWVRGIVLTPESDYLDFQSTRRDYCRSGA